MSLGRAFSLVWAGSATSNLADGLAFVAIPLLAAGLTGDPLLIAGLAAFYSAVRLTVALPIGVWVDRIDHRSILWVANLGRGLAVASLAIAIAAGVESILLLYIVFAVVGVCESAADTAAITIIPAIVPMNDLDRANSRMSAAQLITDEFAGPPLGGLLFGLAAVAPIAATSALYASAGLLFLALPTRREARAEAVNPRKSVARDALEGLQWMSHEPVVRSLALIGALASIAYAAPFAILVLFARDRLGLEPAGYGILLAISALGGLMGSAITVRLSHRFGYRWTIVGALLLGSVTMAGLAVTRNPIVAGLLLVGYILHAVVWGICATSLRQRLVPAELRGRIIASGKVLSLGGLTLGAVLGGLVASAGLGLPFVVAAVLFAICAVIAMMTMRSGGDHDDIAPG